MAQQPVFQLHVRTRFHVGISAARKYRDEEIDRRALAGYRIPDRERIPGPVHLHNVAGLVLDAHRRLRNLCPLPVLVPELGAHVRSLVDFCAVTAVLAPE